MPALPNVSQVAKIIFKSTFGGDADVVNRCYFSFSGTMTNAIAVSLASACATAWTSNLAPLLYNTFTLNSVEVIDLTSATGATGLSAVNDAGGVSTGVALPAQDCMVIKFIIPRRYRGGHPRWYQSGIPSGDLTTPQTFSSGSLSAMSSGFSAMATAIKAFSSGGVTVTSHVNVHYYSGHTNVQYGNVGGSPGYYRAVPTLLGTPGTDLVSSYSTNPNVCSQRRRSLVA